MASAAMEQVGALDELGLDREVAACFLARIARGYHGQPYYNALHGADVYQAVQRTVAFTSASAAAAAATNVT